MIDFELLEELVAFAKYGTLSATAAHLMITQPSVTRGMKKLEQELGVQLFDRSQSNRIVLNDTGKIAVKEAKKLLAAKEDFVEKILNYDHAKRKIIVESVAPGPLYFLIQVQNEIQTPLQVSQQYIKLENVARDLENYKAQLIFTNEEIDTDEIESMYLGVEHLDLGINQESPLAQREKVNFADLAGLQFLVVQDIGLWRQIIEDNIPHAQFLYQKDLDAVSALSKYSNLPFFYTNLTEASSTTFDRFENGKHTQLRIEDSHADVEFYGAYLKSNRKIMQPILRKMIDKWPK